MLSAPFAGTWWRSAKVGEEGLVTALAAVGFARRPPGNEVDLHSGTAREGGYTHASPGRPLMGQEIPGVNAIHLLVVVLEMREEYSCRDHVLERKSAAGQDALQIFHH